MFEEIKSCRACKNQDLKEFMSLGMQFLTGVFPSDKNTKITEGPLTLVKCGDCGLVQLKHNYSLDEMYGDNYGYRSGLNKSMVTHLQNSVAQIRSLIELSDEDIILDIGSNDCTLLKSYPESFQNLVGIDPTATKFAKHYPSRIRFNPTFFSKLAFEKLFPNKKAKVVTSFAMFYDLPDPLQFMKEISSILEVDGLWCMELSYLPLMIKTNSYDSICHEHLEYYCLEQIQYLAQHSDLKIFDVLFNDVNGGSFKVFLTRAESTRPVNKEKVENLLISEKKSGYGGMDVYADFFRRVQQHKTELVTLLQDLKNKKKVMVGLGASTKGNVLLQYCGIGQNFLDAIIEVNEYKFGRLTPGTLIPIISEGEAQKIKPDIKLVLPWHFKKNIIQREMSFLQDGGTLLFPLPEIKLVTLQNCHQELKSQETINGHSMV